MSRPKQWRVNWLRICILPEKFLTSIVLRAGLICKPRFRPVTLPGEMPENIEKAVYRLLNRLAINGFYVKIKNNESCVI